MDEQYAYDDDTLIRKLKKIAIDDGVGGVSPHFILTVSIENKIR